MKRSTTMMMALTVVLGAALAMPAGAFASTLVPHAYETLGVRIAEAWARGQLTRAEKRSIEAMKARTDRAIRAATRDGFVSARERSRIDRDTRQTLATFNAYRDNRAVRYAPPVPRVPRAAVRVVVTSSSHPRGRVNAHRR